MRWAALPRSINAGKPLAMADLRAMLVDLGFVDVTTLLASGNAVFSAEIEDGSVLEHRLHAAAKDRLVLDTPWFVRNHADLAAIVAANPFPEVAADRPSQLVVLFHHAPVTHTLPSGYDGPERLRAIGRETYIDFVAGIGRSKLTSAFTKAKFPPSTGRNWNTVTKLLAATA